MFHRPGKYIIVLLLICFSISVSPSITLAEIKNDSKQQQAFASIEKRIFDLIAYGMEPLGIIDYLDGEIDEECVFNIVLFAKEKFSVSSSALAEIQIPTVLPDDIRKSLELVKNDLSIGFKLLEESMEYLAQYLINRDHILYDISIEKREKGFLFIDGGLNSLATVRLRLHAPGKPEELIPNAWKVGKRYFYKLDKAVLVIPNGMY